MKTDREILSKYDLTNPNVDVLTEIILCAMNEYADQFRKPEKKTLEERRKKFYIKIMEFDSLYGFPLVMEFFDYWTEHGDNAKKMRFEKEKVFDIKKRLERWAKNQKTFSNGKSTKPTTDEAVNGFISQ